MYRIFAKTAHDCFSIVGLMSVADKKTKKKKCRKKQLANKLTSDSRMPVARALVKRSPNTADHVHVNGGVSFFKFFFFLFSVLFRMQILSGLPTIRRTTAGETFSDVLFCRLKYARKHKKRKTPLRCNIIHVKLRAH